MSWQHVESVLEQSRARNAARMVLTVLATHANDQGVCWPGVETVMRKAGVCRTAIHDAFQKLTALGELQIDVGAGAKGCNLYRILLPTSGSGHRDGLPSLRSESPTNIDWIKLRRSPEAHELARDAAALGLLGIIALRTRRHDGFNVQGLKPGEALIGDYENMGFTRQEYRTRLNRLKQWGFITARATNKGTVAAISNADVFEVLECEKVCEKLVFSRV